MIGPNFKRLVARKMALDAVPDGGGIAAALGFLTDPKRIGEVARAATTWVTESINAVRNAREPNPWKSADDETIAGEILKQIEAKKKKGPSHD